MIQTLLGKAYQNWCIDSLLRLKFFRRIHPHFLTATGCLVGVSILPLLILNYPVPAFLCLLLSGFFDTLDGSLARNQQRASSQGAIIDILADRIVEFTTILGLFFIDTDTRALLCLLMLGSILLCVTSFLVVGIFINNTMDKSFHYSPGLMERAEAFLFFSLMILIPSSFVLLSVIFTILVLFTAVQRSLCFVRNPRGVYHH